MRDKNLPYKNNAQRHVERKSSNFIIQLPTSGWGSSGIIFHGPIKGEVEWRALVVVDAIGVVKPWQKAVAVAATQRDSESLMMSQFLIVVV